MPNNPVQFVQNVDALIQAPEPGRKGEEKDFFEDRDDAFSAHKEALVNSLDTIEQTITRAGHGPATYIRVVMREAALAKSYRPNSVLLTPDRFPCVGAGAIGELFFFLPQIYIGELKARIRHADPHVPQVISRTGRAYRATKRLRSEVGAILSIEIVPPGGKRLFPAVAGVQAFSDPHAFPGYLIELFEVPPLQTIANDRWGRRELFNSLFRLLLSLGNGARSYLLPAMGRTPILELQLTTATAIAALVDLSQIETVSAELTETTPIVDPDVDRHEAALSKLAEHPLVRRIDPPIRMSLESDAGEGRALPRTFVIPVHVATRSYPRIGVVDSGVGSHLVGWTIGRFDHLSASDVDSVHGTKVASLVVGGQGMNGPAIAPEADGCEIYDIPLFPRMPFNFHYRGGFTDFLEELEQGIQEAKESHGIRIFNMSINCLTPVQRHSYSTLAARLDAIADRHGVLIINSAGNLSQSESRRPWSATPRDNLAYFASRTSPDTLFQPTETVRGVSVGALNNPGSSQIPDTPARYSRRGPGMQVGVKPDVAHYGGVGPMTDPEPTGLLAAATNGSAIPVCGTSYAAPLVARTLAELDLITERGLAPRTLRTLMLHNAETPQPLTQRGLRELARQFVGFGKPPAAAHMLETSDNKITIVFESHLTAGTARPAIMRFGFEWPESLTDHTTGACTGRVRMTLVYEPPLDPAFGAEFVRVNLDASLKQQQPIPRRDGRPSFSDQATMWGLPATARLPLNERALIDHGLKWWPAKSYTANLSNNGSSNVWRLEVASVTRAETRFPPDGVPFSVVLSIEDPEGQRPIFQSFRRYLQARGIQIDDLRIAHRVRQRQ